jgi:hypothetical protein
MFLRYLSVVVAFGMSLPIFADRAHASEPSVSTNALAMLSAIELAPTGWNPNNPYYWGDLTIGGRGRAPILLELDHSSEAVWRALAARPVRGGGMLAFELHWTGTRSSATAGK